MTSDPNRLHQPTLATKSRLTTSDTDHPLFNVHGFPDDKVTSDPRLRVEAALREAGLHTSKYAREVLASIHPPTAPRPDQHSNITFRDL